MIVILSAGLIATWWLSRFLWGRRNNPDRLPLPPGPKGYPIIGNLLGMPTYKPWEGFDQWSKIYGKLITSPHYIFHHGKFIGDMIFFKILGQPFLVLGSAERTYDLFEKQSQNYSDRAHFPMFIELLVTSSPSYVRHAY